MANNKTITDYITFLEGLRRENRERLHDAAIRWNELANNRSAELSKHLFTIASLVLPLSLFPVTNQEFLITICFEGRLFLIGAWVSFILSLIAGLIHLTREAGFFNKWAEQENERSKAYSEAIFATSAVKAFDRLEEMNKKAAGLIKIPSTPTNFFLYSQEALLILGIIMIGIVLFLTLFSYSLY